MKKTLYLLLTVAGLVQWGCSPSFWGGAAVGALGTGGGYEYNAKRQMDKLEDDRRSGRISRCPKRVRSLGAMPSSARPPGEAARR